MLILTDTQYQALGQAEIRQFVMAVSDGFFVNRPDMLELLGREMVLERMHDAYIYAISVGFSSTSHLVRLMYLSADAYRIYDDPLVDAYLRKSGATPEQRLDDLDAVMNNKLKGNL